MRRNMGWSSRGLRGSTFETLINMTNERYMRDGSAVIQKIPTPITPVAQKPGTGIITQAFYERKSTVDYIGVSGGLPIAFDAKETGRDYLPLQNIHEHQIEFMSAFKKQGGIVFLLVNFWRKSECYILYFDQLHVFWTASKTGGRQSIPYAAFDKALAVGSSAGLALDYLGVVLKR